VQSIDVSNIDGDGQLIENKDRLLTVTSSFVNISSLHSKLLTLLQVVNGNGKADWVLFIELSYI